MGWWVRRCGAVASTFDLEFMQRRVPNWHAAFFCIVMYYGKTS